MIRSRSADKEEGALLEDDFKALQIDNSALVRQQQISATRSAALFARKNHSALGKASASFRPLLTTKLASGKFTSPSRTGDPQASSPSTSSSSSSSRFGRSGRFTSPSYERRRGHTSASADHADDSSQDKKDPLGNVRVQAADIRRRFGRLKKQNEKRDITLSENSNGKTEDSIYNPKENVIRAAAMSAARLSALGKAASLSLSELQSALPTVSGRKTTYRQKVSDTQENLFNVQTTVDQDLVKMLTPIFEDLHSDDHATSISALRVIRKKVSTVRSPPIETYLHMNAFEHVLQELSRSEEHCFEGIWMLSNLTAGNTRQTRMLLDLNIVEVFATCLSNESLRVASQSVWGLANIAGDCAEFRDHLIDQNAIPALLSHAERLMLSDEPGQANVKVNFVGGLNSFHASSTDPAPSRPPSSSSSLATMGSHQSPRPTHNNSSSSHSCPSSPHSMATTSLPMSMPASPSSSTGANMSNSSSNASSIVPAATSSDSKVRKHRKEFETLIWCLSNMCRGKPEVDVERVAEIIPIFLYVVREYITDPYFDAACADAVWGLSYVSAKTENLDALMSMDVLPTVLDALQRVQPRQKVFTPLYRIVGNFGTGPARITSILINSDMLPLIVSYMTSTIFWLKRETLWLLSNLAASDAEHVQVLIDQGVLDKVLDMLFAPDTLPKPHLKEARWIVKNMYLSGTPEQRTLVDSLVKSKLPYNFGDFESSSDFF